MNEIFDIGKLPNRRLSVRKTISLHANTPIGDAICMVKRDMVMRLATTMLEDETFFWERGSKVAQYSLLEYGADCIVLTTEEYEALKREAFSEGLRHATGFMRKLDY